MYSTTYNEGYREYKSPKHICEHPHLYHSVQKEYQKVVTPPIWQTYVEEADHLRHH
ncbi:hypothetical protein ABES21_22145 [Peribacillus frigoritolerans]|uniref:hypothetical protein n=1 Tax=Peribacillus frigoritolerans TaxID=450367 RepID=UPI003D28E8D8